MASARTTPQFTRCLGVIATLFLTLSAATPASSVFVIVPGMLQVAGSGALLAFLLAGLVCLATAFVYAELSSAFPIAGGEYVMVARTLGPLPGFAILGINAVNNILFPPVVGLGVSAVLGAVLPGLPQIPVAVMVVAGSTTCALLNIRVNALVTGIFLAVEVAAIGAIVTLGYADPVRETLPLLTHPVVVAGGSLVPAPAAAIGLATTIAIFALNGYGMAVYFGEEMHAPRSRIGRVVLLCFALTFLLEVLPLLAVLGGVPGLPQLFAADDPFGAFVRARGGGLLGRLVAIGVVVSIINAAIVTVLASARFFWCTGRDGAWARPANRLIGAVHPRLGSPWVSTLVVGVVGIGCCFVSLPFLLLLSGGGLIVTYAAISLAAIAGRRNGSTGRGLYRMPLFPLAPLFTLLALGYVVWTNWLDLAEGRPALIATAVQIVVAVVYYLLALRRRGVWEVHDSVSSPRLLGEGDHRVAMVEGPSSD